MTERNFSSFCAVNCSPTAAGSGASTKKLPTPEGVCPASLIASTPALATGSVALVRTTSTLNLTAGGPILAVRELVFGDAYAGPSEGVIVTLARYVSWAE